MKVLEVQLFSSRCLPTTPAVNARVVFDEDLAPLMPYLNATQKRARYHPDIPQIKFFYDARWVVLTGNTASGMGYDDEESAREGGRKIGEFLREFEAQRDAIDPVETPFEPPSVMEVLKNLPRRAGCRDCGFPSCMAFAAAVARGEAEVEGCPWQGEEGR